MRHDEHRISFMRSARIAMCVMALAACTTQPPSPSVVQYEARRGSLEEMYVPNMSDVALISEEPRTWIWKGAPTLNRFSGFRWVVEQPDIAGIVQRTLPKQSRETATATVNFRFDSARLDSANKSRLNSLPVDVESVRVDGHTDAVGGEGYNDQLSSRRADAVADYLAVRGIPRDKIKTSGHGKANPVASNRSSKGRAQNRRAEVTEELQ
ncbi:OmpA family protein [Burkholderia sp. MBR-1]|uniref:OmpA family protein n=1 Tax=Burkholderia sp. MBR-1 TaxID=2732364 RepID=UPI0015EE59FE|nr:OmpA family protein [Burkholderia sp. MBR-1]QMI49769.1 OmpA family protein [Burkholderia sp. MBR-1]